jgi:hypothetical protein
MHQGLRGNPPAKWATRFKSPGSLVKLHKFKEHRLQSVLPGVVLTEFRSLSTLASYLVEVRTP